MTVKEIFLKWLYKFLNPNFENKFISSLLVIGISLLGYKHIGDFINGLEIYIGNNLIKFSISSGFGFLNFLGVLPIGYSIFFFYILKIRKKKDKKYGNLKKASKVIKKILDENERIFKNHGPNSSSSNISDLRNESQLKAWHTLKLKEIAPNNDKIYNILKNIRKYNSDEIEAVKKMKNHIEAFKKHLSDADYDYSEHQFPIKFSSLILKYCNGGLLNNKYYKDYITWINKYISENGLDLKFKALFGSVLYFKNPSDIDLLLYSENDYNKYDYDNLKILSSEFKNNFNKRLDISFYSNKEKKEFKEFKEKILDIKEF